MQKSLQLQKQKQALMAKQIEQQKVCAMQCIGLSVLSKYTVLQLLIGKLENSSQLSAEERASVMKVSFLVSPCICFIRTTCVDS